MPAAERPAGIDAAGSPPADGGVTAADGGATGAARGVTAAAAARGWNRHLPPQSDTGEGGHTGLPADFLIAPNGRILACKYGSHANDQWTFDEVLDQARHHRV